MGGRIRYRSASPSDSASPLSGASVAWPRARGAGARQQGGGPYGVGATGRTSPPPDPVAWRRLLTGRGRRGGGPDSVEAAGRTSPPPDPAAWRRLRPGRQGGGRLDLTSGRPPLLPPHAAAAEGRARPSPPLGRTVSTRRHHPSPAASPLAPPPVALAPRERRAREKRTRGPRERRAREKQTTRSGDPSLLAG